MEQRKAWCISSSWKTGAVFLRNPASHTSSSVCTHCFETECLTFLPALLLQHPHEAFGMVFNFDGVVVSTPWAIRQHADPTGGEQQQPKGTTSWRSDGSGGSSSGSSSSGGQG
jgi:hypothetical protein